jgi:nucleoside 2-deoxyribosyltransferase
MKKATSFRLYLSGSMANRLAEQVMSERQLAVQLCGKEGIYAVDPGASEQKLWSKGKTAKITIKFPPKIMQAFITQDLWLIRHCDAILVMTGDTPSDGTWWEMCYAKQIGIPVIMIAPKRVRNEIVGWSNFLVDDLVTDLTSAIRIIKRKYVTEKTTHEKYFRTAIKGAKHAVGANVRKKKQAQKKRAQKLEAKKLVKQVIENKTPTTA